MKNRFNNITSKEWLPFQKSWFIYKNDETLYEQHIRFFIKYDDPDFEPNLFYFGNRLKTMQKVSDKNHANIVDENKAIQYALLDLRDEIDKIDSIDAYHVFKKQILELSKHLFQHLKHRRFISIIVQNKIIDNQYFPFAWDLAYSVSTGYTLKDEKIGCIKKSLSKEIENQDFYILNFRKDENSTGKFISIDTKLIEKHPPEKLNFFSKKWGIIKPPRRNKKEILHPAKFPENLIRDFIAHYTKENDNVFDPMSGSGSTQMAAIQMNRNAYGTELSDFFTEIARERLSEHIDSKEQKNQKIRFKILNKDVRNIKRDDFPKIDYIITSPPYWDMLNMKGAENQAKRKKKGLQLNYSDDKKDLGNMEDYQEFIEELVQIYLELIKILKPGGYISIIVKNIKKKGKNYPFAWDLSEKLKEKLTLLPEFFWLQDDINIAPYGYGNTFVSNTFHQYCLTFKKR